MRRVRGQALLAKGLPMVCSPKSLFCLLRSDIKLPAGGDLHIFSPAENAGREQCGAGCMHVGAFDVPHSHKLTTQLFQGVTSNLPSFSQWFHWRSGPSKMSLYTSERWMVGKVRVYDNLVGTAYWRM